jgi:DNA-binding GntR family transcriptional regulator
MAERNDLKLRQVSRLRLVDGVVHSIEDAILSGQMRPGERLIETRIVSELGVSRTTVREALLILERRGLVFSEPRRGTFVTRLSPDDALDLKMTRALLEGYALRIGYNHIDDTAIVRLEELLTQMAACRLPEDIPRLIPIDLAFHRVLIACAGSPRLEELWSSLNGQIGALILSGIENWHATTADLVGLHRQLLMAVRSRDPALMQETVIAHYIRTEKESAASVAAITPLIAAVATRYRGQSEHIRGFVESGLAGEQGGHSSD